MEIIRKSYGNHMETIYGNHHSESLTEHARRIFVCFQAIVLESQ